MSHQCLTLLDGRQQFIGHDAEMGHVGRHPFGGWVQPRHASPRKPMSRLHGSAPLFQFEVPQNGSSTGFLPNEIPDPVRNSLRTEHVRSVSARELNGRPLQDTSQSDSAPIRKGRG